MPEFFTDHKQQLDQMYCSIKQKRKNRANYPWLGELQLKPFVVFSLKHCQIRLNRRFLDKDVEVKDEHT